MIGPMMFVKEGQLVASISAASLIFAHQIMCCVILACYMNVKGWTMVTSRYFVSLFSLVVEYSICILRIDVVLFSVVIYCLQVT